MLNAFLFICCNVQSLKADLIITFQDAFVPAGGTGFVDVFISSDNLLLGDKINGGSYFFEITPFTGTGVLQFLPGLSSIDLVKQSTSDQSLANYVFSPNDVANFSSERQDPFKNQLVQSDGTSSGTPGIFGNDVTVTTPVLLARLELLQVLPGATGTFQIKLKQDIANTLFVDSSSAEVSINAISYTNFGTVTSSASAVPEPSSMILMLTALGFIVAKNSRRRRQRALG